MVYVFMLTAIPLLVYNDIFNFGFVSWDDDINVFENPFITDFSFENIRQFWVAPYADLYIPVTYSLWLITGLFGNLMSGTEETYLDPAYFHGVNLTIHILNGLLVFSLLNTLCRQTKGRKESLTPAFVGAMFFMLHPVQTEAVCWVTGMKDLLTAFFSLLSLYTWFRIKVHHPDNHKFYRFVPLLCFLAALLSKPSAVTLPLAILAIEGLFFKKDFTGTILRLAPWFLFSFLTVLVCRISQSNKISSVFNIWKQAASIPEASGFYVIKLLFPFGLSPDYGLSIESVPGNNGFWVIGILTISLLIFFFRHQSEFTMPVLLFFIFLLPVLGFVPFAFQSISIVADRYMYMAVFGISTGIALFLKKSNSRPALLSVSITLVCFSLMSNFSSERWKSSFELFTRTIMRNPGSYISYNNLGIYFFKMRKYQDAAYYFREALRVRPGFFLSSFNLANSLVNINRLDDAEKHYKNALTANPDHLLANYNLGILYTKRGNYEDAVMQLKKVVSIDKSYTPAYLDLGKLMATLKRYGEATNMYMLALKADKNLTDIYMELDAALLGTGNCVSFTHHNK